MGTPLEEFKTYALKITDSLKRELGGIRTNRPTTGLVDDIKVSYYNQMMPLKQLGTIGISPPREIHIQVWDAEAVPMVSKAIESSSLGITANIEGNTIRIYLPELSEERREELIKHVKRVTEDHRIQLRHARDEANKQIQKLFDESTVNEDQKFKQKEAIQKETDKVNENINGYVEAKVKEIRA